MNTNSRSAQVAFVILIAGAGLFSILSRGEKKPSSSAGAHAAEVTRLPVRPPTTEEVRKPAAHPQEEYPELVAKYGADLVALSKKVSKQEIEFVDIVEGHATAWPADTRLPMDFLIVRPPLDASQEAAIHRGVAESLKRREEKAEKKGKRMQERQADFMAHLLAEDAHAKHKIDDQEYGNILKEEDRRGAFESADVSPVSDPEFLSLVKTILTPEQQKTFRVTERDRSIGWRMQWSTPLDIKERTGEERLRSMKAEIKVATATRDDEVPDSAPAAATDLPPLPR